MLTADLLQRVNFQPCQIPGRLTLSIVTDSARDGFMDEMITGVSGHFHSDAELDEGSLLITFDEPEQRLQWRFSSPYMPTKGAFFGREYQLPEDIADAVRLLRDCLHLDVPLLTVDSGDFSEIINGCLIKNGQPMVVEYPQMERLIDIEAPSDNASDSRYVTYWDDGKQHRCDLMTVAGYLA